MDMGWLSRLRNKRGRGDEPDAHAPPPQEPEPGHSSKRSRPKVARSPGPQRSSTSITVSGLMCMRL